MCCSIRLRNPDFAVGIASEASRLFPVFLGRDSCESLVAKNPHSYSLSSLRRHSMSSISVVWPPTSPAPNSRGPLLSAPGRRLLPLPVTPFSQTSLPSLEPKISVGPRFECLQTKRCALLWSVSYPCSIFHTLVSRFTTLRSQKNFRFLSLPQSNTLRYPSARLLHRPLAVPPPLFACTSARADA